MTIISKIELQENEYLKYTEIGYTEDVNIVNQINEQYDSGLGKFLAENRTKLNLGQINVSAFFAVTSSVNEARTEVDTVEGMNIPLITNINDL